VVDLLLDKTEFHAWASERGFPVPETHVAENEGDLAAILSDIRYPVVLKPLHHTPGWEEKSPNHKAYKLFSKDALGSIGFSMFDAAPKFVVQRWIEGGDDCVHFCLTYVNAAGDEAGAYTGRKYLQWPPQTGSTAICVGEENPELLELTRAVWQAAGFRGLGSLETKYCIDDGEHYITEPTVGRNNLQSYVAVAGGVNMTRLALQDALGAPVVARTRPRGAVWINEPFAILALREAFARRKPERRTLRRLFTALRSVAFAYFSWADPLPFLDFARASLQRLRGASAAPAGRPARNVTIGGRRPQLPRSAGGAVAS
jgi:predicted ATP-grasp superfamily ATP-dependent carboligase